MKTLRELESRLGSRVIAMRWPIIAASVLLVAAAGSGVLFLEFSPDHRIYFAKDNPQLLALEAMERTYGESGNVFFAVAPENRDATSALALEATAWLTEQSWQTPYSTRVDSVTNFQHTTAAGDRLTQADVTTGVMVGMYRNMHQHLLPQGRFPRLDALADRCNAMAAFRRAVLEDVSAAPSNAEPHLAPQQAAP